MANKNMKRWLSDLLESPVKKPLPILTFPSVTPLGVTVREITASSDLQAKGMTYVAAHTDAAAAVGFMDLSVEAECFGSTIRFTDNEVPTVVGAIVSSEEEADALAVPEIGAGRTGIYLDTIRKATATITDRPVFAGMIGSFSLAARLLDVSEIMMDCYDEPETVHKVVEKCTRFLIEYAKAYKAAGADGIMIAEPVSGLLSPALEAEFSSPYVKRIVDAVQDDTFLVIYHNCGNNTPLMVDSFLTIGASAYHFGNAIDLCDMLDRMPASIPVMGNVDPAGQFCMGTPDSIRDATIDLLSRAAKHKNFVISSGCDIPPATPWGNIEAFYKAVNDYYGNK